MQKIPRPSQIFAFFKIYFCLIWRLLPTYSEASSFSNSNHSKPPKCLHPLGQGETSTQPTNFWVPCWFWGGCSSSCSIPMNLCSPLRSPCCRPLRTRWRYGGPTPSAWHRDNEWLQKIWEESLQPSLTWKKYVINLNVRFFLHVYIYN